jgi:hypothetical protein
MIKKFLKTAIQIFNKNKEIKNDNTKKDEEIDVYELTEFDEFFFKTLSGETNDELSNLKELIDAGYKPNDKVIDIIQEQLLISLHYVFMDTSMRFLLKTPISEILERNKDMHLNFILNILKNEFYNKNLLDALLMPSMDEQSWKDLNEKIENSRDSMSKMEIKEVLKNPRWKKNKYIEVQPIFRFREYGIDADISNYLYPEFIDNRGKGKLKYFMNPVYIDRVKDIKIEKAYNVSYLATDSTNYSKTNFKKVAVSNHLVRKYDVLKDEVAYNSKIVSKTVYNSSIDKVTRMNVMNLLDDYINKKGFDKEPTLSKEDEISMNLHKRYQNEVLNSYEYDLYEIKEKRGELINEEEKAKYLLKKNIKNEYLLDLISHMQVIEKEEYVKNIFFIEVLRSVVDRKLATVEDIFLKCVNNEIETQEVKYKDYVQVIYMEYEDKLDSIITLENLKKLQVHTKNKRYVNKLSKKIKEREKEEKDDIIHRFKLSRKNEVRSSHDLLVLAQEANLDEDLYEKVKFVSDKLSLELEKFVTTEEKEYIKNVKVEIITQINHIIDLKDIDPDMKINDVFSKYLNDVTLNLLSINKNLIENQVNFLSLDNKVVKMKGKMQ